jgi:hypothetical protein
MPTVFLNSDEQDWVRRAFVYGYHAGRGHRPAAQAWEELQAVKPIGLFVPAWEGGTNDIRMVHTSPEANPKPNYYHGIKHLDHIGLISPEDSRKTIEGRLLHNRRFGIHRQWLSTVAAIIQAEQYAARTVVTPGPLPFGTRIPEPDEYRIYEWGREFEDYWRLPDQSEPSSAFSRYSAKASILPWQRPNKLKLGLVEWTLPARKQVELPAKTLPKPQPVWYIQESTGFYCFGTQKPALPKTKKPWLPKYKQ